MEIFSGFMVMVSILGFFLMVIWFSLPFVIFAMKGKLDRSYELLETVERRLSSLEQRLGTSDFEIGAQVDEECGTGGPVTEVPPPDAGE